MHSIFFYLAVFGLLAPLPLSAQVSLERQVVGSLGQLTNPGAITISATAGEASVATLRKNDFILLQGFQQAEPEDLTSTEYVSALLGELSVFPNPARDQFWVEYSTDQILPSLNLRVVNLAGRTTSQRRELPQMSGTQRVLVNTQNWPAGLYLIQLSSPSGQLLASAKVMIE